MKNFGMLVLFFSVACGDITSKNSDLKDSSSSNDDTASTGDDTDSDINTEYDVPSFPSGVSTLAGSGEFTSIDGSGEGAAFSEPKAIRMRNDGTLIVADSGTGSIRELSLDGTVRTLQLNGPSPTAPSGLAIANDGTIYVSDFAEHCIYKIVGNDISVFAGSCGVNGYQDGPTALFNLPRGIDLDSEGNLIVADAHNFLIRSVAPNGDVSTIAGSGQEYAGPSEGPVNTANLYIPFGVAVHSSGDIYLSGFDHCIRRISDGQIENVAGLCRNYSNTGTDDGAANNARFDTPLDISFANDDSLLIADCYNDRVRLFDLSQESVNTVAGSSAGYLDGNTEEAMFDIPRSITADRVGNIYVADSVNMRIRVIAKD